MKQLTISQYLKEYRISQGTLAKELDISQAFLCKIKQGSIAISTEKENEIREYFKQKEIEIMLPETVTMNSKYKSKYEELLKAYDNLALLTLELAEENEMLRKEQLNIIKLGEYLKEHPKRKRIRFYSKD